MFITQTLQHAFVVHATSFAVGFSNIVFVLGGTATESAVQRQHAVRATGGGHLEVVVSVVGIYTEGKIASGDDHKKSESSGRDVHVWISRG